MTMSCPPPDSHHGPKALAGADQPLPCLRLHFTGTRGCPAFGPWQPIYDPLAIELPYWLTTGQTPEAGGPSSVSSTSSFPGSSHLSFLFCPEREGPWSRHEFHPENFSYALMSQGAELHAWPSFISRLFAYFYNEGEFPAGWVFLNDLYG